MPIHVWGTDFRRSASSLRSQLFIPAEDRPRRIREILNLGFQDLVYLHTCNRVEFYTTAENHFADTHALWTRLFHYLGLPPESFYQGYHLEGKSAVRHMARVASSLESMVVGESQILGQLKDAVAWTQAAGLPLQRPLRRTFQFAFETAKSVRTQTGIGQSSVSVANLALDRLQSLERELRISQVVLIGTSPICILLKSWFDKNRPQTPVVWVNRTLSRLELLPEAQDARLLSLEEFLKSPPPFSHLFTATSAPHEVLSAAFVSALGGEPKLLFDFAQPPDIEIPAALGAVKLIPLENLAEEARENEKRREEAVGQAIALIEQALREFYLEQKEAPLLRDFNEVAPQFEAALKEAIEDLGKWVGQEQLQQLSKWARGLVLKNLHHSREHLRNILRRAAHHNQLSDSAPPL